MTQSNRIRVVLADDHAILREGLRTFINSQPDLEVVAEAATSLAAVDRVVETGARVLCLDLSMPGWGGVGAIEQVRAIAPRTHVLVLTMHDDPAYLRSAVAAGATGYYLKSTSMHDLLRAIRAVAVGEVAIDPTLAQVPLDVHPDAAGRNAQLSPREQEVLRLLAEGRTNQEIADRLFVGVKSVETYRARIRTKTGLKTRSDFVLYGQHPHAPG